jgi:hypothetical protein
MAKKKKVSFKRGTPAQKARSAAAEDLKRKGHRATGARNAFALATYITKRASPAGRRRLARHTIRKKR